MASVKKDTPPSRHISNAVRIAILSPSVLVSISAVRLLIIANYDPTTASSIASSIGVVGTLLGTLISIVPALLPLLVLAFIVLRKPLLLLFAAIGTALVSPAYATLKEAGPGLNSRSVPSAHCWVWGSQSWKRNLRASWGSLVGTTPSQSEWNMVSRWVLMSSSMLAPPTRSGTYAASHTAVTTLTVPAMAGSRTPAPECATTTGRSPTLPACAAAWRA